jgi:AcrR family transcriptional regulator
VSELEHPRARRQRTDAIENRAKLLSAAKTVFAERGADASLNEIAKRAGVGSGTLYRHFPTLQALLVAILSNDVDALCAQGRHLLSDPDPDAAFRRWLYAFTIHASTMNGLLAAQLAVEFVPGDGNPLAGCHDAIVATGKQLLDRANQKGTTTLSTNINDLLRLATAIAWASQQAPEDPGIIDRLFSISFPGNRARSLPAP